MCVVEGVGWGYLGAILACSKNSDISCTCYIAFDMYTFFLLNFPCTHIPF